MSAPEVIGDDPIPTLATVEPGSGPYDVVVTWADGPRAGVPTPIDLAPILLTYKVFIPLRDAPALLGTVRVSEFGEAIEWGEDDDLAIAGTTLERLAEETMTNADFAAFLKRHSLTRDAAAGQLGIARRLVSYYAKSRPIPRHIALACRYLDLTSPIDDGSSDGARSHPRHLGITGGSRHASGTDSASKRPSPAGLRT